MGLLSLGRKRQQSVILLDRETKELIAEVRVTKIRRGDVRLSFSAEHDVQILRGELVKPAPLVES